MAVVFFLTRLKPGVAAADYERWVREHDYPTARTVPSIKHYRVHRIEGALEGEAPYNYIEYIEITDIESYKKDLASPRIQAVLQEFTKYIGEYVGVHAEVV